MSKSGKREKDRTSKVTTMIATLKSRRHASESRLSSQCRQTKQSVNRAVKPDQKPNNQQKKKFTHRLRIRGPIERKRLHLYPFFKQNDTCTLASTPLAPLIPARRSRFEGGVETTTYVLEKITQPNSRTRKTIPTTAFPSRRVSLVHCDENREVRKRSKAEKRRPKCQIQ
jgi:hypothetical protein